MTNKEKNMRIICALLGLELGDVFIAGGERDSLWRITLENGLEVFEINPGEAGYWNVPFPDVLNIQDLFLHEFEIRKLPNSPLKDLEYVVDSYSGPDYWGEELEGDDK